MLVGVMGGMGPSATVDFLDKLTRLTAADVDQDHLRILALSDPDIPDRSAAIAGQGPSPEAALCERLRILERAGAGIIVIPCNSAHYWFDALQKSVLPPILSIIESTLTELRAAVAPNAKIGVLATPGTIASGIYQHPLAVAGFEPVVLDSDTHDRVIEGGIRLVKAGQIAKGRDSLEQGLAILADSGCTNAILGCTEISVAFGLETECQGVRLYDSNLSLARALLRRLGRTPRF